MTDTDSKILILRNSSAGQTLLTNEDIELLLQNQRMTLRALDVDVNDLLSTGHKLKDTQALKDKTLIMERNLTGIYDWLEDKIAERQDDKERAFRQTLMKQCEQLISRNERIKKNLTDDLAACRYVEAKEALDPVKIAGFLTGLPIAAVTLTKTLISDKPVSLFYAAGAGASLGGLLAFHRQAKKGWKNAATIVSNAPQQIGSSFTVYYLKIRARNSAVAMAWAFSVHAERAQNINAQDIRAKLNPAPRITALKQSM